MATFVLVHGAWHGGWCWKKVTPLLRAAGHEVYTPTLTGLGERAHLLTREVDLDTHIRDIINVLEYEELRDVILVGHSYAGMVIAGVADRVPARLAHLVYLDAFVPRDGQASLSLSPPELEAHLRAQALAEGDGWRVPAPPAAWYGVTRRGRSRLGRGQDRPPAPRGGRPAAAPRAPRPARRDLHPLHAARQLPADRRPGAPAAGLALPRVSHRPRRDDHRAGGAVPVAA